jgi:hypothetical protein
MMACRKIANDKDEACDRSQLPINEVEEDLITLCSKRHRRIHSAPVEAH